MTLKIYIRRNSITPAIKYCKAVFRSNDEGYLVGFGFRVSWLHITEMACPDILGIDTNAAIYTQYIHYII